MNKDLVCGMAVEEATALRTEHDGVAYFFCSEGCRGKFLRTPEAYASGGQRIDSSAMQASAPSGTSWKDYTPLIVVLALTLLAASAKQVSYENGWHWMRWMHDFMGFFLVVFGMFKLFDLPRFADGFQMYDLLAKSFRPYALMYPFIEVGLGLGYLATWQPAFIYIATLIVMAFGAVGVFREVSKGRKIQCACMGTVLRVPLTSVTLLEDLGMAGMAAAMLFQHLR